MAFKTELLKKLGIDSVPEGLSATFTDTNLSVLCIEAPTGKTETVEVKVTGANPIDQVNHNLKSALVKLGAKPVLA